MTDKSHDHDTETQAETTTSDSETRDALYALAEHSIESEFAAEQHSTNDIFAVLSNPGRRYVLTYVLQSEGFVTLSELVDYVTTETSAKMTDEEFRRKVTQELSHTTLPELEEAGYIRYNLERQLVLPTEKMPLVEPHLRLALLQSNLAKRRLESTQ